eukprot:g3454.t1
MTFLRPLARPLALSLFIVSIISSCGGNPPPPIARGQVAQTQPVRVGTIPRTPPPQVVAEAVLIVDVESGRNLYAKNADSRRAVASTQKIITALCVLDAGNIDKTVTIQSYDTLCEPTKLYLKPGEQYTRRELLKVLMVKSANDVGRALARDVGGSVEGFAELMNRKAAQLGMRNSHFVNPHGKEFWNFSSNDYLGLARHPEIIQAFSEGLQRFGAGSTASRLVSGTSSPHTALEETIARSKKTEAALTFTSGFATALSVIPTLVGKVDTVLLDKLSHASLIDASRASGATLRVFPHNDHRTLGHLLEKIRRRSSSRILVITESVFSMDGDLCPLEEILSVCETYGAELLLDEAHAIGILGESGMGLAEQLHLQDRVHFQMGTLSKAIGLSGGYLAASREWIDLITNRARAFIYTTAPPPALAHAAKAAFDLISSAKGKALRGKLFSRGALLDCA